MTEPCTRCGVCCIILGCCSYGYEGTEGICTELSWNGVIATCRLIAENEINPRRLGVGTGCHVVKRGRTYEFALEQRSRL